MPKNRSSVIKKAAAARATPAHPGAIAGPAPMIRPAALDAGWQVLRLDDVVARRQISEQYLREILRSLRTGCSGSAHRLKHDAGDTSRNPQLDSGFVRS
jgi:hypothetical protein